MENIANLPPSQARMHQAPPAIHRPRRRVTGERSDLLYLSSNNSDKPENTGFNRLSPYHKKQAATIRQNAERFVSEVGINHVGFLTLTFPDNVTDHREASRRFDNLRRRFLSVYFPRWMLVKERQKRGAWHYHILVDCQQDIRSGFDFDAFKFISRLRSSPGGWNTYKVAIKNYQRNMARSASPFLRSLWSDLPGRVKSYGFGRCELMPIQTSVDAVAKYVGKYISKHVDARTEQDKGVRLFDSSRGMVRSSTKFQWNGEGSHEWRRKLELFANLCGLSDLDDLAQAFGPKWAFQMQHYIFEVEHLTPPEVVRLRAHCDNRRFDSPILNALDAGSSARNPSPLVKSGSLVDTRTGEVLF